MKKYLLLACILLTGCTNSPITIPVPVTPQIIAQPLGVLPIKKLTASSTPGDVVTAMMQTIYKQNNYIKYLITIGNIKIKQ